MAEQLTGRRRQAKRANGRTGRGGNRAGTLERLERRELLAAHIVGSTASYATIQAAVNAALAGAVITVDAGTYDETVTINKSLTIRGANYGKDGRGTRSAESIVYATQTVFAVDANDVTIDGFTIEGNGANIGAQEGAGVLMAPSIHGTQVLNNIIQNNVTGIYLSNNSNTDPALIQHNLIQNNFEAGNNWQLPVGENGSRGIYTDGTVSGGYLTNVLIDSNTLYNSNFNGGDEDEGMIALQALTAGKQFNITITNNKIGNESKALLATNVTNLVFMGNTISGLNDGSSGPVRFEGNANAVDIQYNTITGNQGPGVAADSSGVSGDSSGFVVNNNDIVGNDGIGVLVIASVYDGPLVAVGDWWGATTGPSGDGPGTGSAVWANGVSGHGVSPKGAAGGGPVTYSPWATALIDITKIPAPAAPTGLGATGLSASSVQLNWTPQMSTATGQLIQRSTDGVSFTTIATVPALLNAYTDTGLSGSTAYTYRVIASNPTGNSAATPAAKATTLSAAGGTVALSSLGWTTATAGYGSVTKNLSVNGNPITLAGTAYASGVTANAASTITYNLAGQYTGFSSAVGIDAEEDSKGTGHVEFQVIGDGVVLFDSGAMTNDQVKQVNVGVAGVQTLQLVATNTIANNIDYDHADWAGATLTLGSTLPAAPTGLSVLLSGTAAAKLSWTAGGSNQTSYTVQRSTDGVTFTTVAAALAATTYTDAGPLAAGTTYQYRVLANNTQGSSAPSAVASLVTPPVGTITVSLSDLTPTTATTGYGIVMRDASVGGHTLTLGGVTYAKGMGVHAVSNLVYNLAGQYTTFTSDVGVDDEEDAAGVGSVDFQVIGDGRVLFDSGVLHNGVAATHVSVSVAGVQALTLVATNGVAGSIDYDHADWAGATLTGVPTVPAAPTHLVAAAQTYSTVSLSWTAGSTNATSYAVDRSTDGVSFATVTTTVVGTATSWTDPASLSATTKYYYRIRAVNGAGASANSAVASVTTPIKRTITYLSDLTATSATAGYGTVQKDASISGNTITVAGVTYAKGIGTHAASTIVYNLAGAYTSFVSTVGIDDEELGKGTGEVEFQVYGDGVLLYDSGVLTNGQSANIAVSIAGVKTLTLVATNGIPDDIDYDHADWAGAQVIV